MGRRDSSRASPLARRADGEDEGTPGGRGVANAGARSDVSRDAGVLEQPRPPARVVIEAVEPEVDGGRFAAKRVVGDRVEVRADVFAEGHDRVAAALCHRAPGGEWREVAMEPIAPVGDRLGARFDVDRLGAHEYTIEAWVDVFGSWRHGLERKAEAGVGVQGELLEGAAILDAAADRAEAAAQRLAAAAPRGDASAAPDDAASEARDDATLLRGAAARLRGAAPEADRVTAAGSEVLGEAVARHPDRSNARRYDRVLSLQVERPRAACGSWYEFFPRSCSPTPGRHGTLRDAEVRLAEAAAMGFDVVYLPPVHPIGETHRKGRNNAPTGAPGDPGSPWAIGAASGGHTAIHPDLGTLADFDRFVARAAELGVEVAIDLAFQCSPDHPWVREHPQWFRHRPDGTIQYAENPPKKYQDIFPLDFESRDWRALWQELLDVALFWVERGIRIFRVDNPHTKPIAFWEWLIAEVRRRHPDVVFLAEAFTRPSVLKHLAKIGFSQSYTYFTWRNTKEEITAYLTELTQTTVREYLRPNLFANTPDILPEFLQTGQRSAFAVRLALAATLAGSWGIYGPPFDLCVSDALPGREEYLDSEKYEIRSWTADSPHSLRPLIARLNRIRRDNPPLLTHGPVRFVPVDNAQIVAYLRTADDAHPVLVVVNLDPNYVQSGFVELPLADLLLDGERPYQMHDLVGDGRYLWRGARNYVQLDPAASPAHVFRLRRHVRTERDFDYYL